MFIFSTREIRGDKDKYQFFWSEIQRGSMTSFFISYSCRDILSARRPTEAFKGQDLGFWIVDWEGIPPTVDWWKEIERGIEVAYIFLFLISPDSARSKVCQREIEHAAKISKFSERRDWGYQ